MFPPSINFGLHQPIEVPLTDGWQLMSFTEKTNEYPEYADETPPQWMTASPEAPFSRLIPLYDTEKVWNVTVNGTVRSLDGLSDGAYEFELRHPCSSEPIEQDYELGPAAGAGVGSISEAFQIITHQALEVWMRKGEGSEDARWVSGGINTSCFSGGCP